MIYSYTVTLYTITQMKHKLRLNLSILIVQEMSKNWSYVLSLKMLADFFEYLVYLLAITSKPFVEWTPLVDHEISHNILIWRFSLSLKIWYPIPSTFFPVLPLIIISLQRENEWTSRKFDEEFMVRSQWSKKEDKYIQVSN